jgi:hypothetical protein
MKVSRLAGGCLYPDLTLCQALSFRGFVFIAVIKKRSVMRTFFSTTTYATLWHFEIKEQYNHDPVFSSLI